MKYLQVVALLCSFIAFTNCRPNTGNSGIPPREDGDQYDTVSGEVPNDTGAGNKNGRSKRSMLVNSDSTGKLWPSRNIPYTTNTTNWTSRQKNYLKRVIEFFERVTCIDFKDKTSTDNNYLTIEDCGWRAGWNGGCWGELGFRNKGQQWVCLTGNNDCKTPGLMFHEIGHALGFAHEHQRSDRDSYISITDSNIEAGSSGSFTKKGSSGWLRSPYDFASVMHYELASFGANGAETISPKGTAAQKTARENLLDMVRYKMLSFQDAKTLNEKYQCAGVSSGTCSINTAGCADGYWDKNCNCIKKDGYYDTHNCVDLWPTWGTATQCQTWKNWNPSECTSEPVWMGFYCRKTCGKCFKP